MPTIATWNVNSVNARLANVLAWLGSAKPDVVLLQEIKCQDRGIPDRGRGRSRLQRRDTRPEELQRRRDPEPAAARGRGARPARRSRRRAGALPRGHRAASWVASIYLPNGNPIGTEKFAYKLAWMERLRAHAAALLELDEPVVLGGDFNVIPEPMDCHDPKAWLGDALFQPESRRAFRALLHLGFTEAFRALHPDERGAYTFWDYQGGAFQLDHGIRIDHLLLSPQAADRLVGCTIDKNPRRQPKASDHTPVIVELQAS